MIASTLLLSLLAAEKIEPVEWLDKDRVKVAAEIRNSSSAREHTKAQIRLMKLAKKACKGKGRAVSENGLLVEGNGSKRGLRISEVYVCIPE